MEVWKDIPGYKGIYQASSFGRIRSLDKTLWNGKGYYIKKGRILKFGTLPTGYKVCNLCNNGKTINRRVNRLVALSFIINPENKPEVNHKDGNKRNNFYNNLKWVTPKENMQHAHTMGLIDRKTTKVTNKDVLEIRKLKKFFTNVELGKIYNTTSGNISAIIRRVSWKHI